MNYLQLVQRLSVEAGASGTVVSTVAGQTGEAGRLCNWINTAWVDIQSEHQDWQWMRKQASFVTVAGQATYRVGSGLDIALTDFGMWARNTFRNYVTSVGLTSEIFMDYIDYEAWRNSYQYGALRNTQSRPMVFAIGPDKSICVGPTAAAGYSVTGDYYSVPSEMAADGDIPALPTQFHMAIVWRALQFYGMYEAAPEAVARGKDEFDKVMSRIAIDRLPGVGLAGALA